MGERMMYQQKPKFSRRQFLAGTTAGAALIVLHPYSANAAANQAHLRIM